MPDFASYAITQTLDKAGAPTGGYTLCAKICDPLSGKMLSDYTKTMISFTLSVPGLSSGDHQELADLIGQTILLRKAGLG